MTFNRNEIIDGALELIGVKAADEGADSSDVSKAITALNMMIATWQSTGAHLWSRESATVFLQPTQFKYILGAGSTDHAAEVYTTSALSSAIVATATTIPMTVTTGLLVADKIGVKLDAGSIHWSTVASLSPTVINDALPSDAASGNLIYYYTTDIAKPLRIPDARYEQGTGDNISEIEMVRLARIDYLNLPNKTTPGNANQFYYKPDVLKGELFVWSVPTSTSTVINITYYRPLLAFTSASDNGDWPDEWKECLMYNLAVRMAPKYGKQVMPDVKELAIALYNNLLDWDDEPASVFFQYSQGVGQ